MAHAILVKHVSHLFPHVPTFAENIPTFQLVQSGTLSAQNPHCPSTYIVLPGIIRLIVRPISADVSDTF